MFIFDGANKIVTIDPSAVPVNKIVSFKVIDLYSAWKDWVVNGEGRQYPALFDVTGGDAITDVVNAGSYFFLRTDLGWAVTPPEVNGVTIIVEGNLFPRVVGAFAIIPRDGYTATIMTQTSSLTQAVHLETGTSGLTPEESTKLDNIPTPQDIWDYVDRTLTASSTSSLTTEQNNKLMGLPTAAQIATEVLESEI